MQAGIETPPLEEVTLFIFRRDLRVRDNRGLAKALSYGNVVPIFIFTPEQVDPAVNQRYTVQYSK